MKPRSLLSLKEGRDEPIPKKEHMAYTLKTPIKVGYRRPITLVPDEALDIMANGQYASSEILQGDSTVTVDPASTKNSVKIWVYGDGAMGDKVARVKADGHVGEGEVEITLDLNWTVNHPDATAFGVPAEGADEPIPGVPPVVV
jgi:hypothetical protein